VTTDINNNNAADACGPQGEPPTATQDICETRFHWDMYHPRAITTGTSTFGTEAVTKGYTDPQGLYFVLKVTGPFTLTSRDTTTARFETTEFLERIRPFTGQGQHCVVGVSKGLLTAGSPQNTRFRQLVSEQNGNALTTTDAGLLNALCGPVSGDKHLVTNAFSPQATAGTFVSGVFWARTTTTAAGANLGPGDGLTVAALLTVAPNKVSDDTKDGIRLGETLTTLAKEWDDGSKTYVWVDNDPFATTVTPPPPSP